MKEHPILFSGPMVRAILAGQKTQTRRVMKSYPDVQGWRGEPLQYFGAFGTWGYPANSSLLKCPYGNSGDRLWVRETWRKSVSQHESVYYRADEQYNTGKEWGWKPSIHMLRSASRVTLEITNVRIERLNNISEEDAIAEGMGTLLDQPYHEAVFMKHRVRFREIWNKINKKRGFGWDTNPWVWVIEFRRPIK